MRNKRGHSLDAALRIKSALINIRDTREARTSASRKLKPHRP